MVRVILLFTAILTISCQNRNQQIDIKNGDLLFVSSGKSDLSNAINEVTQTHNKNNFYHIALVEVASDSIWVLHSSTENGSERVSYNDFKKQMEKDGSKITLYRIKEDLEIDFSAAIAKAKTMLGKPYNFTYILSDTAFYCSDFVYNAFTDNQIFEMEPMTFKKTNSNEFHPTWIEFYKKLDIEIPEGKLGCNPNGMASSPNIRRIGDIN